MPAADVDPLLVEKIPQNAAARKREFEVQLVHPAHDGQIGRRHRSGQVIDAAAADPERLGLLGNGQWVRAVDHRFALSRPALLSAPDKKSLVSVSSPIFACSVFTSTAGVDGSDLGSDPNTPAAPSRSCAFQAVIWLGWTSNGCASSASVFSPFTAAKATFALKAGVWFRRGRLLIVSPALRPSWPPSGRNSTYQPCSKISSQLSVQQTHKQV